MGVAIALIGVGLFGAAGLIVLFTLAYRVLPRRARPEVADRVSARITAVLALAIAAILIWSGQIRHVSRGAPSLDQHCDEAGEYIYRTVEDVDGVFYDAPPASNRFHERESEARSYVSPPERNYRFYETNARSSASVTRTTLGPKGLEAVQQERPSARYGYTWMPLETIAESNAGLHGDETVVYDLQTREVLARRVLYYHEPRLSGANYGEPVKVCPQIKLVHDWRWIDGQPRDSYDFVSRVLKPRAFTPAEDIEFHHLARGMGKRRKSCSGTIWVGRNIDLQDVTFVRDHQDLELSIKGTADSLSCFLYFITPPGVGAAPPAIQFSNGAVLSGEEVEARAPDPSAKPPRRRR